MSIVFDLFYRHDYLSLRSSKEGAFYRMEYWRTVERIGAVVRRGWRSTAEVVDTVRKVNMIIS